MLLWPVLPVRGANLLHTFTRGCYNAQTTPLRTGNPGRCCARYRSGQSSDCLGTCTMEECLFSPRFKSDGFVNFDADVNDDEEVTVTTKHQEPRGVECVAGSVL